MKWSLHSGDDLYASFFLLFLQGNDKCIERHLDETGWVSWVSAAARQSELLMLLLQVLILQHSHLHWMRELTATPPPHHLSGLLVSSNQLQGLCMHHHWSAEPLAASCRGTVWQSTAAAAQPFTAPVWRVCLTPAFDLRPIKSLQPVTVNQVLKWR